MLPYKEMLNAAKRKSDDSGTFSLSKKPRYNRAMSTACSNDLVIRCEQLKAERRNLPVHAARRRLLQQLRELHDSTAIVIGETGSGKTTQVPQYIYEAGLSKRGKIACTQPRRVAAVTVAQRVADEKGCSLGTLVGYNVRFDDCTSDSSELVYMTDGMLLREALLDPLLRRYSVVILDEAHERTVHTDVLFGVVKSAQRRRKSSSNRNVSPLQVIVMSATMDVDHFSKYFNKAAVLYVEGRQHHVELLYARQPQSDYIFSSLVTVFQIHQSAPPHEDILVFLTGQEEIESVVKSVRDISRDLPSGSSPLVVYPLYAALPPSQQLRVFGPTSKGSRKVIVSTNIAETSVTIRGVKHVVDCGRVKAKCYRPSSGLDLLAVTWVSKAQAWQRSGRAGREAPGICYRLYTEDEFDRLTENTTPEIVRCNLASVVLQLLAMGLTNVVDFDFMDKPSPESLHKALQQLEWLGAIESSTEPKLTSVGKQLAAFPLDPRLAKVILSASNFCCLDEVLTIVAMLSVDSVLHAPYSKREEALTVRRKFIATEGDHITLLNMFCAYKASNGNKNWCRDNFVNPRNMKLVAEVRKQLRDICVGLSMPVDSLDVHDTSTIRKCWCAGFFMNAAEHIRDGNYVTVAGRKQVSLHPSSVLFHSRPNCVIYNELVQTTKCYMRDLSVVDPDWLYDASPPSFQTQCRQFGRLHLEHQSVH